MQANERIAAWVGVPWREPTLSSSWECQTCGNLWQSCQCFYDSDIEAWHGGSGLIRKIEASGMMDAFVDRMARLIDHDPQSAYPFVDGYLAGLHAEPEQLAQALAYCLEQREATH